MVLRPKQTRAGGPTALLASYIYLSAAQYQLRILRLTIAPATTRPPKSINELVAGSGTAVIVPEYEVVIVAPPIASERIV